MSRFIWVNSKELHDEHLGMHENSSGVKYSSFSDQDEGFIYDTVAKYKILDFGNNEAYYPSCGTKPDDEYLEVIMDALNEYKI